MGEVTTYCSLWKMVIPMHDVLCLTDHDEIIFYDGDSYKPQDVAEAARTEIRSGLSVDSGGVRTILRQSNLSPQDVRNGALDGSGFFQFRHDWRSAETELLFRGRLGEVSFSGEDILMEWLGQASLLDQATGRVFSRQCDASFGDVRCGLNLSDFPDETICPRSFVACRDQFQNAVNFRGFPYLLGDDALQAGVRDADRRDGSSRYQ